FRATATGATGKVRATFTTPVKNAAIDVISLSGNNTLNPIGLTGINSGNSTSPNWILSGTLTRGSSMLLFGDLTDGTSTPATWSTTSPALFSQIDSFLQVNGGQTYRFANYFGGSSALSVNGSPSATAQWGTIALEILPATTPTPTPTATFTPTPTPTPTATPSATSTPTPTPTPTPTCNPPSVTTNPSNQTVTYGVASVSFTAAASGSPAPTVQWQVSTGGPFSDIPGATSTTYTINNPTVS